jgi:hypothetical protein
MAAPQRHTGGGGGYCSECDDYFTTIELFHGHTVPTHSRKRDLGLRDTVCFDAFTFFIDADSAEDTDDQRSQDRDRDFEEQDDIRVRVCVTCVMSVCLC